MNTVQKLQKAQKHINDAVTLLREAALENESLEDCFGYHMLDITTKLSEIAYSESSCLHMTSGIQYIIDSVGSKWQNKQNYTAPPAKDTYYYFLCLMNDGQQRTLHAMAKNQVLAMDKIMESSNVKEIIRPTNQ